MKKYYPGTTQYYLEIDRENLSLDKQVQQLKQSYAELVSLQTKLLGRHRQAEGASTDEQAVVKKARGIIKTCNALPLGNNTLRSQVYEIWERCREIVDNPYLRLDGEIKP